MLKKCVKRILLFLTAPLRFAIRYELYNTASVRRDVNQVLNQRDIHQVLLKNALESTADYVAKKMPHVDSVTSKFDLLSLAMQKANVTNKLICEFGVFSGDTINHIASLTNEKVYGFDSFEGLPERWRDGFGKGHFKKENLPSTLQNVELVVGWFDNTLPIFISRHPKQAGFLHIDCDLYSSTKTIFDLLTPYIQPGCVIVFDEYFNYPGWEEGEFKALDEFLTKTGLTYEYLGYNRLSEQVAIIIK